MSKKYTVTVGIPAYNEEINIGNILTSLLNQKLVCFNLKEIIVYSDGSKDKTNDIVKNMKKLYPVIDIVENKKREGKIYRLNQMFRNSKSDFLVVLDADINLISDDFLENLVKEIIIDPKAVMSVADQIPLRANNFAGKVIYASYLMWDYIRLGIPNKDHVQNFYGAATAYRKSFIKKLNIPTELAEERLYIYLMAKKYDGFRYCESAKLLYWPVSTLKEFIKQKNRSFGKNQPILDKIFSIDCESNYKIAWKYKFSGIIKSFYKQPLYTPMALILNYILSKLTLMTPPQNSPTWEISLSTKKPFDYEKYY